jgi:hypothetical protein
MDFVKVVSLAVLLVSVPLRRNHLSIVVKRSQNLLATLIGSF